VEFPLQLVVRSAAKRQRPNERLRRSLRWGRPPSNRKQQASHSVATGQPDCLCRRVASRPAVSAATLMVSVAVACPFTVTADGVTLQVMRLVDSAQVRATAPDPAFTGSRSFQVICPTKPRLSRIQANLRAAIEDFITWYCSEPRLAFGRTVVLRYRYDLEVRRLAPVTINLRLAAVRRLAYDASDNGLLNPDLAAGIRRVKGPNALDCVSGTG